MTQKKVTITDIAKAAGVSKTTISRYLNGRFDLMSPETRRRIESVIDVSGYQPSTIARSLKNKRSLLLGIVVSDQSSPFSTAVLLGVGDALRNTEYVPVFVNCDDDPAKERYQISFLLSRGVDGLIVNTTSYENPFLVNLEARGVPIVLCDRYINCLLYTSLFQLCPANRAGRKFACLFLVAVQKQVGGLHLVRAHGNGRHLGGLRVYLNLHFHSFRHGAVLNGKGSRFLFNF